MLGSGLFLLCLYRWLIKGDTSWGYIAGGMVVMWIAKIWLAGMVFAETAVSGP